MQETNDKCILEDALDDSINIFFWRVICECWVQSRPSTLMGDDEDHHPETLQCDGLEISNQSRHPVLVSWNVLVNGSIPPCHEYAVEGCQSKDVRHDLDSWRLGGHGQSESTPDLNQDTNHQESSEVAMEPTEPLADGWDELEEVEIPPEDGTNDMWEKVHKSCCVVGPGYLPEGGGVVECWITRMSVENFEIVLGIPEVILDETSQSDGPRDDEEDDHPGDNEDISSFHDCCFVWLLGCLVAWFDLISFD